MATTQPTLVPAVVEPDFDSFAERQAIAGFLAGYGDATRHAYTLDLRQWLGWCTSHYLRVFAVKQAPHRAVRPESGARRQGSGDCGAAAVDDCRVLPVLRRRTVVPVSPAVHLRRPKLNYESNATGLDRNELGMFLVQAGLAGGRDHGLACLLA